MRRALNKQVGGVVSMPVPRSNQQIRADIKQRIASGEFNLGTPVLDNRELKPMSPTPAKTGRVLRMFCVENMLSPTSPTKCFLVF